MQGGVGGVGGGDVERNGPRKNELLRESPPEQSVVRMAIEKKGADEKRRDGSGTAAAQQSTTSVKFK